MNVRTFASLLTFCSSGLVGCRSTGVLERALREGPAGLSRACTNGIAGTCAALGRAATPRASLPIQQGLTSLDRARFTVVVPASSRPIYLVRDGESARELKAARRTGPNSDAAVDRLRVERLRPDVDFELIVTDADGTLWDRRTFRALDDTKRRARVALVSSADDTFPKEAARMWPVVFGQDADAIVLLGDTTYLDHGGSGPSFIAPDPATIWRRHVETRCTLPLYFAPRLKPVLALWDDHDFGYDNADGTYPHRAESRDAFLTFFDQADAEANWTRGPGIAAAWSAFGVEIILTDDRSFRSVDRAAGAQTHFGSAQEDWIAERLSRADRPVLLAAGDPFFGGSTAFESYEASHPESFRAQLARWRESLRTPVALLSGDRHLSEIVRVPEDALGISTFEITSSGLHAKVFPNAFREYPDPRRLAGAAGVLNFSVIEIMRAERGLLRLGVQSFGPDAQLLYQRTLAVKK